MDNLKIRKAKIEDLPKLLDFEQEIVKTERKYDSTLKSGDISFYNLKDLILSDTSVIFVAEFNSVVVASGSVELRRSAVFEKHANHAYLGFMYVEPEYRNKGINNLILKAIMTWSESNGVEELCLNVCEQNQVAINAYEKVGFSRLSAKMRMNLKDD